MIKDSHLTHSSFVVLFKILQTFEHILVHYQALAGVKYCTESEIKILTKLKAVTNNVTQKLIKK